MFYGLLRNYINNKGKNYYSVHGQGALDNVSQALFNLEAPQLQKNCNKFKYRLSTIIPFISSAGHIEYWGYVNLRRRALDPDLPPSDFDLTSLRKKSVHSLYDYVDNNFPNAKYNNSLKYWQNNDQDFSCKLMANLVNIHVDHDKSDYPYVIANWNHPHSRCGSGNLLTLIDPLTKLRRGEPLGNYCTLPSYKNAKVLFENSDYEKGDESEKLMGLIDLVLRAKASRYNIFNIYSADFYHGFDNKEDDFYSNSPNSSDVLKVWRYKRSKEVCGEPVNGGDGSNLASAIGDDPCDPNTAMKDPVGSIDPNKAIDNNKFLAGGTTPNPDYNPVNPWSNIGNIGKIAKLIEMHRKVIKAVAEFEDRQIKINLQEGFYDPKQQ